MRILTWNLWWRFGPWEERQPAIAAELRAVDPDIAFFQEVWAADGRDQIDELAAIGGWHQARTHHLAGDRAGQPHQFGNAIISRWPLDVVEQISLSGQDGAPSHRSALAVRIDAPGGPLLAAVTHLAWQYDLSEVREQQLSEIVAMIDRHRDRGRPPADGRRADPGTEPPPVLLAGDLNAVPTSDEVRRLTGESRPYQPGLVFTDVWAAVGDGPGHTWTRENPNASEALSPRRRLDYLFVSWPRPKPYANPLTATLVGVDPRGGVVGSDHYGVVAELDDRTAPEEAP